MLTWCPSGELSSCENHELSLLCDQVSINHQPQQHMNPHGTRPIQIWSVLAGPWGTKGLPRPQVDFSTGSDSANLHWTMHHVKPSKERHWLYNHSVNTCLFYQACKSTWHCLSWRLVQSSHDTLAGVHYCSRTRRGFSLIVTSKGFLMTIICDPKIDLIRCAFLCQVLF